MEIGNINLNQIVEDFVSPSDYKIMHKTRMGLSYVQHRRESAYRIHCQCGGYYLNIYPHSHMKTKMHKNFLLNPVFTITIDTSLTELPTILPAQI